MLPDVHRLHRRSEITETIRRGRRASRGGLVVHYVAGQADSSPRAAFAVGKSVGNSVVRHRVLRRLRAVTMTVLPSLPAGSAVVVRALPASATESSAELAADLRAALERVRRPPSSRPPSRPPGGPPADPPADLSATVPVDPPADPPIHARTRPSEIFTLGPVPPGGWARLGWTLGLPFRVILLAIVGLYRLTISPILPPTCRFHPSCSAYGLEAIQVHGPFKGVALGTWRVLRCNPWNLGGLDPVPPRGAWRPEIHPDGTPRLVA